MPESHTGLDLVSTNSILFNHNFHSSILRSINYTTFLKIYLTFKSSSPFNLDNSIFQQIHIEFSPLIINTHHRPQSHLFTPLPISTRFISLPSNQYPTSNHQSQILSLPNFHNSLLEFYFRSS